MSEENKNEDKNYRTECQFVKPGDVNFKAIKTITRNSCSVHNVATYTMRQRVFAYRNAN